MFQTLIAEHGSACTANDLMLPRLEHQHYSLQCRTKQSGSESLRRRLSTSKRHQPTLCACACAATTTVSEFHTNCKLHYVLCMRLDKRTIQNRFISITPLSHCYSCIRIIRTPWSAVQRKTFPPWVFKMVKEQISTRQCQASTHSTISLTISITHKPMVNLKSLQQLIAWQKILQADDFGYSRLLLHGGFTSRGQSQP